MSWTHKGRKLAHPLVILRRLMFWPVVQILRAAMFSAIAAGWEIREAKRVWRGQG